MNNEQEIWKNVEGYDGAYQVSNLGRVRSRKHGEWRLIRPSVDKVGYCRVIFTCNGKHTTRFVHRLVATAFVDGYKDGLTVDHTNGKRTDNRATNLRWMTQTKNASLPMHNYHITKAYQQIKKNKNVRQQKQMRLPNDIDGEEWRDIPGYEGRYMVSNFGRVMSYGKRGGGANLLRQHDTTNRGCSFGEYKKVILCKEGKTKNACVHRLVAMAFVDGYREGYVVNHKDENPQNNHVDNLEWISNRANLNYGTARQRLCESIRKSKARAVLKFTLSGELVAEYPTITEACTSVGVKGNYQIRECCHGNRSDYHGYRWQWKDNSKQ